MVLRSAPVFVSGHVGRPGEYLIGRDVTLRQVLSLAGGVSQRGSEGRIKIIRTTDGVKHQLKVNLDDRSDPATRLSFPRYL